MDKAYEFCLNAVRGIDKERFVAGLFAPEPKRRHLYALYAFYEDVSRISDLVTDPFPGEIRLQWWRDALNGVSHGDVDAYPVAAALLDTIRRFKLPVEMFLNMLEALSFDLYDEPMPTLEELECYARETECSLIRLAARILCGDERENIAVIAGHAGIANTLTEMMRAVPVHAARKQLYLPADLLDRHCVDSQAIFEGRTTPALNAVLAEMRERTRWHLEQTRFSVAQLTEETAPAFLMTGLVERYLKMMERRGYDPLKTAIDIPLWRRYWILYRAAGQARRHFASQER